MAEFVFVKSSWSSSAGECVEAALNVPDVVALRDSKDYAVGMVQVSPVVWRRFVGALQARRHIHQGT